LAAEPEVLVRFLALPDFLNNIGSGIGSIQQPLEDKRSYLKEKRVAPV
jgi:hypothetical protein